MSTSTKKITPADPFMTQKYIKNLLSHYCLAFQNGMPWPGSINDHGGDRLQWKGLDPGQAQPRGDWAVVH